MDKTDLVTPAIAEALKANELDKPKHLYLWNSKKNKYEVLDAKTGKFVQEVDKSELIFSSAVYSEAAGEIVCEAIRMGMTMKQINEDHRLPSTSAIYAWKRNHPEFALKMDQALRDRADFYHDEAISAVKEASLHKDEVPYLKLKVDTMKWAAEKSDPERFGTRKSDLLVNAPSVIVLNTGINRVDAPSLEELLANPEDAKPATTIEATFTEIKGENNE